MPVRNLNVLLTVPPLFGHTLIFLKVPFGLTKQESPFLPFSKSNHCISPASRRKQQWCAGLALGDGESCCIGLSVSVVQKLPPRPRSSYQPDVAEHGVEKKVSSQEPSKGVATGVSKALLRYKPPAGLGDCAPAASGWVGAGPHSLGLSEAALPRPGQSGFGPLERGEQLAAWI